MMPEDYEEFISLTLEDKEFKETVKNARKKLDMPMAPAMPCKISKNSQHGANHKTAYGKFDAASSSSSRPYCRKR